jgi:hypothetical protein
MKIPDGQKPPVRNLIGLLGLISKILRSSYFTAPPELIERDDDGSASAIELLQCLRREMSKPPAMDIARGTAIIGLLEDIEGSIERWDDAMSMFEKACDKVEMFVWQDEYFLQKGFAEAAIFCCQLYHLRKETIWGDGDD